MAKSRFEISFHHDGTFSGGSDKTNGVIEWVISDCTIVLGNTIVNRWIRRRREVEDCAPTSLNTIRHLGYQPNRRTEIMFWESTYFFNASHVEFRLNGIRYNTRILKAGGVIRRLSLWRGTFKTDPGTCCSDWN
jgi:hypothetical protein